jgi:hypothetical protein
MRTVREPVPTWRIAFALAAVSVVGCGGSDADVAKQGDAQADTGGAGGTGADGTGAGDLDAGGGITCTLDGILLHLLGDDAWTDCGALQSESTAIEISDARGCVTTAIAKGQSFRLSWRVVGLDSFVYRAIVGVRDRGSLTLTSLHSDSGIGGPEQVTYERCASIVFLQSCDHRDPGCLECRPSVDDRVCHCSGPSPEEPSRAASIVCE